MSRIFLIIVLFLSSFLVADALEFADKSVLSQGNWVKIRVAESGVCKLTAEELMKMGFSEPSKVKVFGYGGGELPQNFSKMKIDDLNQVATYDGGDFLLFYACGPVSWKKDLGSLLMYSPSINPYSSYGYYFLTTDGGDAIRRIKTEAVEKSEKTMRVDNYLYRECKFTEEFNFVNSGRYWYGDIIKPNEKKTYSFVVPDICKDKEVYSKYVYAIYGPGASKIRCTFEDNYVTIDGYGVTDHAKAYEFSKELNGIPSGEKLNFNIEYSASISSKYAALRLLAFSAYRKLIMNGTQMDFRNPDCVDDNAYSTFVMYGVRKNTMVWNVTDVADVTQVPLVVAGDSAKFVKKTDKILEFVAVNPDGDDFVEAEYVGEVENQNLHSLNGVSFVIITHPDFISEAQRLAQKHEEVDNVKAAVVTAEQVYNEFSSGTPDVTAYRRLMKMVYDRVGQHDVHLLLFGDGCFDNRGITATKQNKQNNYLLTYQSEESSDESTSYTTDDYFAMLDDADCASIPITSATLDIGVGRIPVSSSAEAKVAVDKIFAYLDGHQFGKWKNRVLLLADDNELRPNGINKFFGFSEVIASMISDSNLAMDIKKIYLDAYPRETGSNGNRYPAVEKELVEEIEQGVSFLNYIGHSGKTGFAAERIFTQSQAGSIYNKNLGFWFTASCEFTRFDDLSSSGGEDLLLNPQGGVIGLCSSSRTVFDTQNDQINRRFVSFLYSRDEMGRPLRYGDIFRLSKTELENDRNKLCFSLFCDPMLRPSYPELIVRTDSIQTLDGHRLDTMKALEQVRVFASIVDEQGNVIKSFNGKSNVQIYDKSQIQYTMANTFVKEEDIVRERFAFKDRPNVLFSGSAEVEDGSFSFVFRVPKDINYSVGTGRISYYAYDEENGFDAQGADEGFFIGGSDSTAILSDSIGPVVELYVNSKSFEDGGIVNTSPVFYANVFDESGINASGSGIGHDITLTLNDSKEPLNLNSYFIYKSGAYNEGQVACQLPGLEPGRYTVTFKVWDLLNNSTTKQIHFNVVEGTNVSFEQLTLSSNPASDHVLIRAEHNRPQTVVAYRLMVFDMLGRIVYLSDEKRELSAGTVEMEWDLKNNSGTRVQQGSYLCKMLLSAEGCEEKQKTKILMVLPQ